MAGSQRLVDTTPGASITDDTTRQVDGTGGHAAASFLIDITTFTGAWTVSLRVQIGTTVITIASLVLSATGVFRIPLTADFSATRMAIPEPTEVFYDETTAGSLAAQIIAVYGD